MCASLPHRYQSLSGSASTTKAPEARELSNKHSHLSAQHSLNSASTGKQVCRLIPISRSSQPASSCLMNFTQLQEVCCGVVDRRCSISSVFAPFFFFTADSQTQIKVYIKGCTINTGGFASSISFERCWPNLRMRCNNFSHKLHGVMWEKTQDA